MHQNRATVTQKNALVGVLLSASLLAGCGGDAEQTTAVTTPQTGTPVSDTPPAIGSRLNKTNITTCANQTEHQLACTPQALGDLHLLNQDAEVKAGLTPTYVKVSRNSSECVEDQNSGLTWELKTRDGGLRDVEYGYYWYEPDLRKNGGFAGYEEFLDFGLPPGEICGNFLENCNTATYLAKLNQQQYCGYSDWRLPTARELEGIIDYGKASAPFVFAPLDVTVDVPYWTASPAASDSEFAKVFYLATPSNALNEKFYPSGVIAVRGEATRRTQTSPN